MNQFHDNYIITQQYYRHFILNVLNQFHCKYIITQKYYKWPRICSVFVITIKSFPHSWLIVGFVKRVTRRVPHVEQELLILPEHISSPLTFSGVRVAWSLVLCIMFCRSLFVLFLLAIVLCVSLRSADLDFPFGIFKLFLFQSGASSIKKSYQACWSDTKVHRHHLIERGPSGSMS